MKIQKLITVMLLMAISFSTLHAFAINFLDDDHCSVSEYAHEIDQVSSHELSGDVCDIHHVFHIAFLLPEVILLQTNTLPNSVPINTVVKYDFQSYKNFLKPPISLS